LNNFPTEANENLSLASRIIYQDENCLVVNKIPGEAVEGAGDGMSDLSLELARLIGGNQQGVKETVLVAKNSGRANSFWPKAVNRLDVPVTGCSLFALNSDSLAYLNRLFSGGSENKIEKRYWAIAEKPKRPETTFAEEGELVHWLEYDSKKNKSFVYRQEAPGRKKAALRYRIAGSGDNYLFIKIALITGRRHQIRAQLADAGMCIKGDLKYGARRSEKNGGIRLHARSLVFPNPSLKTEKIIVTAQPPYMDSLWEAFLQITKKKTESLA
jgi:23S rRNA pseudouridine1911/1915/1917 synthase